MRPAGRGFRDDARNSSPPSIRNDYEKYGRIVKSTGVKVD
jgi:hypothetical protein